MLGLVRHLAILVVALAWSCSPYTFTSAAPNEGSWEIPHDGAAAPVEDAKDCTYVGRLLAHGDPVEIKDTLKHRVARYGGTHFRIEQQSGRTIMLDGKKLKLGKAKGEDDLTLEASVWQCSTKPDKSPTEES
jgi:hypothetical protein